MVFDPSKLAAEFEASLRTPTPIASVKTGRELCAAFDEVTQPIQQMVQLMDAAVKKSHGPIASVRLDPARSEPGDQVVTAIVKATRSDKVPLALPVRYTGEGFMISEGFLSASSLMFEVEELASSVRDKLQEYFR